MYFQIQNVISNKKLTGVRRGREKDLEFPVRVPKNLDKFVPILSLLGPIVKVEQLYQEWLETDTLIWAPYRKRTVSTCPCP